MASQFNPLTMYKRRIFIITKAKRQSVNDKLEAMGYGPDSFSCALNGKGSSASAPATHYVCDVQMNEGMYIDFKNVVGQGKEKNVPLEDRLNEALKGENLKRR